MSFELSSKNCTESDVARMSSGNAFHVEGPGGEWRVWNAYVPLPGT